MIKGVILILVFFALLITSIISESNTKIEDPFQKNREAKKNEEVIMDLNQYSLKEITLLGVIESEETKWLVVSDPVKKIYHLKVNDILGKESAIIVNLSLDEVFLKFTSAEEDFIKENAMHMGMIKLKNSDDVFVLSLVEHK